MRQRALGLLVAVVAAAALASASGAATTKAQTVARIDVSTRAAVIHYLHSIHVRAKGAVIERGLRNYAGAHCPGKHWVCSSTKHTVVQIASVGGANRFRCSTARCAVVQVAPHALATNTATCIKTTGLSQSCTINQSSSSGNNTAIVYENEAKTSGLTQTAAASASITQRATGSGVNTACVSQIVNVTGSTVAKKGTPVTVTLEAHQGVAITQDSSSGGNSAAQSATSAGSCTGSTVTQTQILSSKASGTGSITQNENAASSGANMTIDIEQNQSAGFLGSAHGPNTASFEQDNTLTAIANTPGGPVNQTQSSTSGGLLGTVNQDSRDPSTITATQVEQQCEDAATTLLATCHTGSGDADFNGTYALHQMQFGPEGVAKPLPHRRRVGYSVHKGVGQATQTGNSADRFTLSQTSTQDNDTGSGQTNNVEGDCSTSGTCTESQTTNVDGQPTTNTQSGQNLKSSINCTGSNCQASVPPAPSIDSKPPDPSNSSFAEFTFSDTQEGVSLLCEIDDGAFAVCTSPQDYSGLADGPHTFSVEAKDANGNVGPATSYSWTIDTAPSFSQNGSLLTAKNVDVGEFGYGGMRENTGGGPAGDGTGTITVAGVSGTVLKALLLWNGPSNDPNPDANAVVSLAGQQVTGTNIGTASSNCWSQYANSYSYEADVTSLVNGDGSYALADFVKSGDTVSDINGVSLIVFYDDGSGSNNRNVVLWTGNDSNFAYGNDPAGWDETLTGVPYSGAGNPTLDVVVGDGQNPGNPTSDDGGISVNGTEIVPAGGNFEGDSTPAGPADALGDLWDVKSFPLPSTLLTAGANSLEVTSPFVNDCLSLVAVAANMPAAAQFPVTLQAPRRQTRSTLSVPTPAASGLGAAGGLRRTK